MVISIGNRAAIVDDGSLRQRIRPPLRLSQGWQAAISGSRGSATCRSNDLRVRVVEAVLAGSSRRQAAVRFGVSASSAIRWVQLWHERGDVGAKPQGGDRRSGRIEAHGDFVLDQVAQTPDVTLEELQTLLRERGIAVGIGTVWRFFDRHGISFKKNRARRRAGPS